MDSGALSPKASQETFISLVQLDPSPIETPPLDTEKELPELPKEGPELIGPGALEHSATTSSLGLSGSGHGALYYLTRIQRYSTYALSIFTSIHLANTSLIPLVTRSVPASESYLLLAREIYQTPLTEPLFIGLPIVAHIASGIAIRLLRRSQNLRRYGGATPGTRALRHAHTSASSTSSSSSASIRIWPPVSYISMSGYGFVVFLLAHTFVNRGLPLAVDGDSANIGLGYVAHGFARHPLQSWLAYTGLLAVGCGHMIWGWAKWLGLAQRAGWKTDMKSVRSTGNIAVDKRNRQNRRRIWLGIQGVSLAVTALWTAGGLGVVARGGLTQGWVGKVYDDLIGRISL